MELSKNCAHCGSVFYKPKCCGMPEWNSRRKFCSSECKKDSQNGKPTKKHGRKYPHLLKEKEMEPCRICGNPTKYRIEKSGKFSGKVHCGAKECKEQSNQIKRDRLKASYAEKKEERLAKMICPWPSTKRATKEELMLLDFMTGLGFTHQLVLKTGLKRDEGPSCYYPDFGHESLKICVEIDGSSHKINGRKERDERRDEILSSLGWKTLRIPAELVADDLELAKSLILRNY